MISKVSLILFDIYAVIVSNLTPNFGYFNDYQMFLGFTYQGTEHQPGSWLGHSVFLVIKFLLALWQGFLLKK